MVEELTQESKTKLDIMRKLCDDLAAALQEFTKMPDELDESYSQKVAMIEELPNILQDFGESLPVLFVGQIFWPLLGDPDDMGPDDIRSAALLSSLYGSDHVNKFRRMGKFMAAVQEA